MGPAPASALCVLLAAGAGKRFQGTAHKLLTPIVTSHGTEPVVLASARAMVEARLGNCIVVEGAVDVAEALAPLGEGAVQIMRNDDWETGMRSSVLTAVRIARERGCDQVVIGLGDQPFIDPSTWAALAAADSPIAIATYGGRRGNPVKLAASTWDELASGGGDPDTGARSLVSRHPEWVAEIPCRGDDRDIDTLEDLPPWKH